MKCKSRLLQSRHVTTIPLPGNFDSASSEKKYSISTREVIICYLGGPTSALVFITVLKDKGFPLSNSNWNVEVNPYFFSKFKTTLQAFPNVLKIYCCCEWGENKPLIIQTTQNINCGLKKDPTQKFSAHETELDLDLYLLFIFSWSLPKTSETKNIRQRQKNVREEMPQNSTNDIWKQKFHSCQFYFCTWTKPALMLDTIPLFVQREKSPQLNVLVKA